MNELRGWLAGMALLLSLLSIGCKSEDSNTVSTSQMSANLTASAAGDGRTKVSASLRRGDPTSLVFVKLEGGDRLYATRIEPVTQDEREKRMHRDSALGRSYATSFETEEAATTFAVELDRTKTGKVSTSQSTVTLPTPFELFWVDDPAGMTPAPTPFSRSSATPYYVVWDPFTAPDFEPGDELRFEVTGSCIQRYTGNIDWVGGEDSLLLTGVLIDRPAPNDGPCDLEVELTLRREGSVDGEFHDGVFLGEQVRSLTLQSVP